MPRSMLLQTEIYPNLKSISELYKMYMKSLDSFILESLVHPDTRLSPPVRRQSSFPERSRFASHLNKNFKTVYKECQ